MMSSFRIPPNRHLAMIVAAIFAVGLGMGTIGATLVYRQKVNDLERTTASLSAFNQAQAKTISQLSLDQALPKTGNAAVSTPAAAAPAPSAAPQVELATQPAPTLKTPVAAAAPTPPPPRPQVRAATPPPRQESPKPAAAPVAVAAAQTRTTPAQAIEALKQQKAASATPTPAAPPPPTTVTMQQAGIAGIDTASVKFASGRVVTVGGEFPTGEKLISVSPTEGRIVTDRRIIQLAKPAPVQ